MSPTDCCSTEASTENEDACVHVVCRCCGAGCCGADRRTANCC